LKSDVSCFYCMQVQYCAVNMSLRDVRNTYFIKKILGLILPLGKKNCPFPAYCQ
jgi:hypothetical protein